MTSETRRKEILTRDNNRCRACGFSDSLTIEVDHVVPRTLNGSDDSNNLQALCHFCNNVKGNVLIDSLPIRNAIVGFGSQEEVTKNRLNFQAHVASKRQQQIDVLISQARDWKSAGTRGLIIKRRLDKLTTSGISDKIMAAIKQ